MKLTKEQIGVVRNALVNNDDLYGESACTALELANAYRRVEALLEQRERGRRNIMAVALDDGATITTDELRRALYGEG